MARTVGGGVMVITTLGRGAGRRWRWSTKSAHCFLCGKTELFEGVQKCALFPPTNLTHLGVGGISIGSMAGRL